jgi:predicted alpha/beta-hydrolase family hydrolase
MLEENGREPASFSIVVNDSRTTARLYLAAADDAPCFVFAHGAGAGQGHAFMTSTARALAARGIDVVTFDFLYTAAGRRSPDRAPVLEATWRAVVAETRSQGLPRAAALVIGGKSMGGRIASQVLASDDAPAADGLVLLGYPLHPPGRPDTLRIAHLPSLRTPTLVVQGSRDEFGGEDEVRQAFAVVPGPVDWHVVGDGDHSFKVRRSAGMPQAEAIAAIHDRVGAWILARSSLTSAGQR